MLWASTYKTTLQNIYNLQKRVLKLCIGKKNNYKYPFKCQILTQNPISIFAKTNRLSIFDLNKIQTAKFIFQTIHKLSPPCFTDIFSLVSNVHSHNTRAERRHDLFHKHAKTNSRKITVSVRGPILWNSIPVNIRAIMSVFVFLTFLKRHFLSS